MDEKLFLLYAKTYDEDALIAHWGCDDVHYYFKLYILF
jgi:hypothetical protein